MDDRHYVCEQCGLKWFVPASRAEPQGELHCGECDAVLTRVEDLIAGDEIVAATQSVGA